MNAPARMRLKCTRVLAAKRTQRKGAVIMPRPLYLLFCFRCRLKSRANNRSGGVAGTGAHGNQLNAGRSGASLWNVFGPIRAEILEELVRTEDVVICDFWFI